MTVIEKNDRLKRKESCISVFVLHKFGPFIDSHLSLSWWHPGLLWLLWTHILKLWRYTGDVIHPLRSLQGRPRTLGHNDVQYLLCLILKLLHRSRHLVWPYVSGSRHVGENTARWFKGPAWRPVTHRKEREHAPCCIVTGYITFLLSWGLRKPP